MAGIINFTHEEVKYSAKKLTNLIAYPCLVSLDYSPGLSLRDRLISPRIFLDRIRFSTLERVGLVGLRFFAGTRLDKIRSRKRSVTSALFRCCDLYFSDTRIITPSSVMRLLSLPATINFFVSLRQSDSCGDHNSSTRDSVLFTC